jgi:hypothetical protein
MDEDVARVDVVRDEVRPNGLEDNDAATPEMAGPLLAPFEDAPLELFDISGVRSVTMSRTRMS